MKLPLRWGFDGTWSAWGMFSGGGGAWDLMPGEAGGERGAV